MSAPTQAPTQAPKADDRDYLDKGVEAGLKKYGGAKFQDSQKNRATIEKITDYIRKIFEKATGCVAPFSPVGVLQIARASADYQFACRKKVPEKVSN